MTCLDSRHSSFPSLLLDAFSCYPSILGIGFWFWCRYILKVFSVRFRHVASTTKSSAHELLKYHTNSFFPLTYSQLCYKKILYTTLGYLYLFSPGKYFDRFFLQFLFSKVWLCCILNCIAVANLRPFKDCSKYGIFSIWYKFYLECLMIANILVIMNVGASYLK
jgi:hypothetical protein